jgi:putative tryptophan/tyrosine transport system ATP-binding protein
MLILNNISKVFNPGTENEVQALRNVSFNVKEGEFAVIIGTNGSGKSTTLNTVAGNIIADTGTVSIDGVDVSSMPVHRRAKFIGRVFQNPFTGTAPTLTLMDNIALALKRGRSRGLGIAVQSPLRSEIQERLSSLGMGLEDRMEQAIESLSGGQRQALTLLMATWLKPKVLLLDEHTAALDPKNAEEVLQLSEELIRAGNITTLMVTHSMRHAAQMGDRLLMMHRGEIIREFKGAEKARLRPSELEQRFAEIRQTELLDESAAKLIEQLYV